MGTDVTKDILAEYDSQSATYDAFGKSVATLLERLLQARSVDHLPLEWRTKERVSLAEKIVRPDKAGKYEKLSDLTDISGVRIVAFLQEDCEKICQIIRENFEIDYANSIRKLEELDPDRFGYTSIHYVVSHVNERLEWPEFSDFEGMRAEIQVRTVLQHSWAAIDWKLRYKSKAEVPVALRRRLHRISALLEAADAEFSAISASAERIRAEYKLSIDNNKYDIPIDAESLSLYINENKSLGTLVARARKNKLFIFKIPKETHGRLASLLYALEAGNFTRLSDVHNLIRKDQAEHIETLKAVFAEWRLRVDNPIMSVEAMIRILATLSRPREVALEMIDAAPMNLNLGNILREQISRLGPN